MAPPSPIFPQGPGPIITARSFDATTDRELEDIAALLETSGRFRVLRRLVVPSPPPVPAAERGISQQQAVEELWSEKQPSLDFASPEQLEGTVAFLCSPLADQITGTTISVDGGWTAE